MIQEHIHKLLFEHDCVIIPDFGGLITHYEPARIHPVRHAFLPPAKRVAFNEKLKMNDGLLISTFAYDKRISPEEAHQQVGAFVRQLQEELHASQRFELRGIGLFRLNAEQKIEFEYVASSNFRNDSFGLPDLISRPVLAADAAAGLRLLLKEKKEDQAVSTAKPSLRRKIRKIYDTAAVLAITGLSCSALYFISLQNNYNLSSLNPIALFAQPGIISTFNDGLSWEPEETVSLPKAPAKAGVAEASVPEKTLVAASPQAAKANTPKAEPVVAPPLKAAEKAVVAKAPKPGKVVVPLPKAVVAAPKKSSSLTINTPTNRYYVIAGGYSNLKNAKWGLKQFSTQAGKVILPVKPGALHRVSVQDYASKAEALLQLPELKKKYGNNIWILNY